MLGLSPKAQARVLVALVLVATASAFASSVGFPFVAWDDPRYVTDNPLVVHPLGQGVRELLTTPLLGYPQSVTVLSYALNRWLFGMAPWSFHLVNLALHLVNVGLVANLAATWGLTNRQSAVAAMLFGLHPLIVEPVCWVTGRKDLLAACFVLLAVTILVRRPEAPSPWRLVAATALSILGIGAKPSVFVAAPLLWIAATTARPGWDRRRLALALAPLAVLGPATAFVGFPVGSDLHTRSVVDAALDVLGAWTLQIEHLVWPVDLVTKYFRFPGDPSNAAMALGACAIGLVGAALVRLDRRSPAFAGLAFTLVAYAPVSCVVAANRWTADSYMYLPLVGISIAAVAGARAVIPARWDRVLAGPVPRSGSSSASPRSRSRSIGVPRRESGSPRWSGTR
jgi:hypothetical protein